MKVSITKEELGRALTIVSKGMSSRSTLPILSGIYLSTNDKQLIFQTTDLEISIKHISSAFVEEQGKIVVPGKIFFDIVRSLPDAAVQLSTIGERIKIECLSSHFELNTLNPDDFPNFPEVKKNQEVSLPSFKLNTMIKKVSKAVSKDENRAILTGILFSINENHISLVATDSYRLSIIEADLQTSLNINTEVIIPGRIFEEVIKSAAGEDKISIGIADNQIVFEFGDTVFITRKIEGSYPNYKQLIPSEKNTTIIVKTEPFVTAVKRVSLLAQTHSPIKFSFNADKQTIEISSQVQDVGGAIESVPAEIEGETIDIAFNQQYISDGLSVINTENTKIEVQTALKPGIIKSEDEEGKNLYLAMPVRIS